MKKSARRFLSFFGCLAHTTFLATANSANAADLDTRLVGHWRNTIHKPTINYAKDSHYRLFQDGSFNFYAKGIANGRQVTEGPVYGTWFADGSVLRFLLALLCLVWVSCLGGIVLTGLSCPGIPPRGSWVDARCWRTPCGQSVNVASERGDNPGTTPLTYRTLAALEGRVAPGLPPLIHPLTTLRRARPLPIADACGATVTDASQKVGGAQPGIYPHQT